MFLLIIRRLLQVEVEDLLMRISDFIKLRSPVDYENLQSILMWTNLHRRLNIHSVCTFVFLPPREAAEQPELDLILRGNTLRARGCINTLISC